MRGTAVGLLWHWVGCVTLLLLHRSGYGLQLTVQSPQTALVQSRVVLPCSFTVKSPPINPLFLAVMWYFGEKEVLRFDNKEKVASPGMSFNEQQAKQGNASLIIDRATISNHGTYRCLIIYSPDRQQKEIQLNVHAAPVVKIQIRALEKDKANQILCSITDFFPVDIKVTWLRNGQLVSGSEFSGIQKSADGTFRVNNTVTLTANQIQDHPVIACQVEHISLQSPLQDSFKVQYGVAPKVRLASLGTLDGNEQIYICEARGFSPEPLSIGWFVNDKKTELSRKSVDGVFNKEIYYRVNLTEDKPPPQISCNVQHETLSKPVEKSIDVKQFNECTRHCYHGVTAFFAVSFIAALAFILYIYLQQKRFHVSHIYAEQRWTEMKVVLCCMASECPEEAQVTWTVIEDGQDPIEVSDSQRNKDTEDGQELLKVSDSHQNKDVERGPLLQSDYTVKNYQTKAGARHNVTSMMSFTPEAMRHTNMEVRCKILCQGKSIEKTLKSSFHSYKKPETGMDDSIKVSLDDSGCVECSITLEKFFPKQIQIQWSNGDDQNLQSKEDIISNDMNGTYNAVSKCKFPGKLLENPQFRVTWSHQSMDKPESRKISVKDFPWRPVMEDITVPPITHGREASFQCIVRNYFPGNLKLRWLRKEAGKPERYEVSPSDKYKFPVLEETQQPDKTFTTIATLVSLLTIEDEGTEFICQVTHPLLEKPLEKSTGELTVTGKPVVQKIFQDDGWIILEVGGFYTKDLVVTWEQAKEKHGPYTKMKNERIQNNLTQRGDDGYCLSSGCRARKQWKPQTDKYFKASIQYSALKSPEEFYFKRSSAQLYSLDSDGQKKELTKKENVVSNKKGASKQDQEEPQGDKKDEGNTEETKEDP